MNILRKAMAGEVEALKPVLAGTYAAILRFQRDRTPANEDALRTAMAPAIERLMRFRSLMPEYKQSDFRLLEAEWQRLDASDLIMLFDHCINIMHVRLERQRSDAEKHAPWSAEMLRLLDSYRETPSLAPVAGDFLCSGIPASGGRAQGMARVVPDVGALTALLPGEIVVCRMSFPDWMPYLDGIVALVTDQGGTLSHMAIMAREMGVPCVVGCGNATAVIQTGMEIVVDGDLGVVNEL